MKESVDTTSKNSIKVGVQADTGNADSTKPNNAKATAISTANTTPQHVLNTLSIRLTPKSFIATLQWIIVHIVHSGTKDSHDAQSLIQYGTDHTNHLDTTHMGRYLQEEMDSDCM